MRKAMQKSLDLGELLIYMHGFYILVMSSLIFCIIAWDLILLIPTNAILDVWVHKKKNRRKWAKKKAKTPPKKRKAGPALLYVDIAN